MENRSYITIEEADRLNRALAKYGLKNVSNFSTIKSRCNAVLKLFNPFLKGENAGNIEGLKEAIKNYFTKVFSEEAAAEIEIIESWKYTNPEIYEVTVANIRQNVALRCNNVMRAIFENGNNTVVEIAKDMLYEEKHINGNIGKIMWLVVDEEMAAVDRHKAGIPEISYFKTEDVVELTPSDEENYGSKKVE